MWPFRRNKGRSQEPKVEDSIPPTKDECLDTLAGNRSPVWQEVNFFNERQGVPKMETATEAHPARVMFSYIQYERYAQEQGWIAEESE